MNKARYSATKIAAFIGQWQKLNPYRGSFKHHNAIFKIAFNAFLDGFCIDAETKKRFYL